MSNKQWITFTKKNRIVLCLLACSSLLILLLTLNTTVSQAQFQTVQTEYLRLVYYDKEHSYVVPHLTRCFENSLRFHRAFFDYTPTEDIVVLLEDFDDYGYAGATSLPHNYIRVGIEPYKYVYETSPTNERFNWVMSHELVHVVAADKASKMDNFFRSIFFGKVIPISEHPISMIYSYLGSPRYYAPRWYHEGIAVFMETWMSGGIGRALSGYDEMAFRTMIRDNSYIYDVIGLESEGTTIDFQVGVNSYLYGTRFVSYLAYHYGPEKVVSWFSRTNDSKKYFASQFKKVYGVSLDDEWSKWIQWEHQWQQANLDLIRLYPMTNARQISQYALGSVSRTYYDSSNQKIYAAINYPGQLAHIAAIDIDDGTIQEICNVPTPALYYVSSLAYDQSSGTLFFTTNNSRGWRDIYTVDIRTGESKRLLRSVRTGDLAFNPTDKSLWGMQHHLGICSVVRFPPPYKEWQTILPLEYGKDIFDLDISPDGLYLIGSLVDVTGRQTLIRMEIERLLLGDTSYEILVEFDNNTSPENFKFSPDGKYLFGTSYYTGVSNVFRYDLTEKKLEAISNCETGYFRPLSISTDSLVVFEYTGQGFVPKMIPNEPLEDISAIKYLGQAIVEKHPTVKSWNIGSPLQIDVDSVTTSTGEYRGLRNLELASAYPIVEGYKDYVGVGMRLDFLDPLALHSADISASYTPKKTFPSDERFHLSFNYQYWQWKIYAGYNGADFYDLFGPTKTSRKGYWLGATYNNYLLYDRPKTMEYTIDVAGYGNLETLPDYQNVEASFDKYLTAQVKLDYKNYRRSLGAVEREQGIRWQLTGHNNYVNKKNFPRFYTKLDLGRLLPIHHSSIWLRGSSGYSFGERDEPFANFYFGGFGNNWVDYQNAQRYREYYSFPGVELNEIGGTNFGKMLIEWTLPPLRFRRFGFTSLYVRWARLALFTSGLVTNVDSNPDKRKLLNAGGQIDIRIVMFSLLNSTFSVAYGTAIEKNHRPSQEFMISLKIL